MKKSNSMLGGHCPCLKTNHTYNHEKCAREGQHVCGPCECDCHYDAQCMRCGATDHETKDCS